MPEISVRGFDGSSGGSVATGQNRVEPQPDFSNMTLEQIEAWELAHSVAPDTQTLPAAAVVNPVTHAPVEQAPDNRDMDQLAAEGVVDRTVVGERAYDEPEATQSDTAAEPEPVNAQYVQGEPFVHVRAYLQASGPTELILSIPEAEALHNQLYKALVEEPRGS